MPPTTDIHQHLWPEPLLTALAARREAPMLVRHREGWAVRTPGEPEVPLDPAAHDADARVAQLRAHGVDRAVIAPSVPLGIEALPADEAAPLLEAYHAGVAALPAPLGAWAAVALAAPDPAALAAQLDAGCVGACIAADALARPEGYEALGGVLELLECRAAPLLIHPGPAPHTRAAAAAGERLPAWWPSVTSYVSGMHAAWFAFAAFGRDRHPRLRVCFAMLAGLAPLQRERLVARGGPRAAVDPGVFLETSSYGPRAIDAVIREVGVDRLVHGSDVPVLAMADPPSGDALAVAVTQRNPALLLTPDPTPEVHP